jgi:hypothetical protein
VESEGIRDAVLRIYTVLEIAQTLPKPQRRFRDMLILIWYSCTQTYTRKRRTPMDIPAMVQGWTHVVIAMSTGHDKATVDHAEFAIDELMSPLLTAPVKQLRQFWQELEQALKADTRVPFVVWRIFESYGNAIVKQAQDQEIIALKTTLATEIATLVEQDIQPDILTAIIGALQWRPPDVLQEIKAEVKRGRKPRLEGKESCLFLVVGDHEVML